MASVINTNMASISAQRYLSTAQSKLATSFERLSSGMRINPPRTMQLAWVFPRL